MEEGTPGVPVGPRSHWGRSDPLGGPWTGRDSDHLQRRRTQRSRILSLPRHLTGRDNCGRRDSLIGKPDEKSSVPRVLSGDGEGDRHYDEWTLWPYFVVLKFHQYPPLSQTMCCVQISPSSVLVKGEGRRVPV